MAEEKVPVKTKEAGQTAGQKAEEVYAAEKAAAGKGAKEADAPQEAGVAGEGEVPGEAPLYMPHRLPPDVQAPGVRQPGAEAPGAVYGVPGQRYAHAGYPVPPVGAGPAGWPQPGHGYWPQGQPTIGYAYPHQGLPMAGHGGGNGYPVMGAYSGPPLAHGAYAWPVVPVQPGVAGYSADVAAGQGAGVPAAYGFPGQPGAAPAQKKSGTGRQVAAGVVFLIVGGLGALAFMTFFGIALWQVLSETRTRSTEVLLPFLLAALFFALPIVAGIRCVQGKGKAWTLAALAPAVLATGAVVLLAVAEGLDRGAAVVLVLVGVPFAGMVAGTLLRWIPE